VADYIDEVFGEGGLFAQRFPGYRPRPPQIALARGTDRCIAGDGVFLGEGPCGTGKGLAYAVPAVWHANQGRKPVVIATANHALQEQLCEKDLPLLAELLPWKFTFALLKGRQNYLCSARLEDLGGSPPQLLPDERRELDDVLAWARTTKTGDFAELSFAPRQPVKRALTVSAEDCSGSRCEHYDACFANKAKQRAADSDIIVTNYHLLFTHIALAMKTGQDLILPAFDTLIMDEVHAAADVARTCFGWELTESALKRLATDAAKHRIDGTGELVVAGRDVFARIAAHARVNTKEKRVRQPGVVPLQRVRQALTAIGNGARERADQLEEVGALVPNPARKKAELERIERRAAEISEQLVAATSVANKDVVSWIDLDDTWRATLSSAPVQVGGLLSRALFGRVRSAVLVSATMTTTGTFEFVKRELGVPGGAEELIVPSPFDFIAQSMMVVPRDMPAPDSPAYLDAVAEKVAEVIDACNGRTLGLFTSYRALNHVYDRIAGGRHRVLRQGDQPKTQLVQEFRKDVHSVLLGTSSMWTGVDVPGEALTAVVIDKLPFPSPGDPVLEALKERDGKAAFHRHFLPRCIMELQQGVGRLIRSVGDKGVVVLLDRRLIEKPYGGLILSSLPRMARGSLASIPSFLSEDPDAWAS
jgi:ATP-dependent DNA helicase DinG